MINIKSIKNKLNTSYLKDVLTSLSGTTISQAITLSMAPILTRIYSPADYGVLGIYMSITAILFVFTTLQYSQSILLTNSKEEEFQVIKICTLIATFFSLLVGLVVFLISVMNCDLFQSLNLNQWAYMLPVSTALFGYNTILTKTLNKYKKYKGISISNVVTSLTTVSLSLGLGLLYQNYTGLLIGLIAGQFARFISLIIFSKPFIQFINETEIPLITTIKKYKKFPLFTIPTEFLYGWSNQLPVYFFNAYFNTTVIGHFNYGKRMVSLPISLITGAVGNVFAQQAAEQYNKTGECKKVFVNTFKMLGIPLLPVFIVLGFFAPQIFSFVFGSEWIIAGEYVRILSPMFYLKAIVSPLSYMYIIKNKQDEDLYLHIISFGLTAFSLYIGLVQNYQITSILKLFTTSYCIIYVVYLYRSYKFSIK